MSTVLITFMIEEIILVIFLMLMLRRYKSPKVPKMVMLTVYSSWCISFSAFFALSADVYNTVNETEKDELLDTVLQSFWFGFYWLSLIFNL